MCTHYDPRYIAKLIGLGIGATTHLIVCVTLAYVVPASVTS